MNREYAPHEAVAIVRKVFPLATGVTLSVLWLWRKENILTPTGTTTYHNRQCYTVADITLIALVAQFHLFGHSKEWLVPAIKKVRPWLNRKAVTPTVMLTTDGAVAQVYDCFKQIVMMDTRRICVTYPIGALYLDVRQACAAAPARRDMSAAAKRGHTKRGRWFGHGNAAWQRLGV